MQFDDKLINLQTLINLNYISCKWQHFLKARHIYNVRLDFLKCVSSYDPDYTLGKLKSLPISDRAAIASLFKASLFYNDLDSSDDASRSSEKTKLYEEIKLYKDETNVVFEIYKCKIGVVIEYLKLFVGSLLEIVVKALCLLIPVSQFISSGISILAHLLVAGCILWPVKIFIKGIVGGAAKGIVEAIKYCKQDKNKHFSSFVIAPIWFFWEFGKSILAQCCFSGVDDVNILYSWLQSNGKAYFSTMFLPCLISVRDDCVEIGEDIRKIISLIRGEGENNGQIETDTTVQETNNLARINSNNQEGNFIP